MQAISATQCRHRVYFTLRRVQFHRRGRSRPIKQQRRIRFYINQARCRPSPSSYPGTLLSGLHVRAVAHSGTCALFSLITQTARRCRCHLRVVAVTRIPPAPSVGCAASCSGRRHRLGHRTAPRRGRRGPCQVSRRCPAAPGGRPLGGPRSARLLCAGGRVCMEGRRAARLTLAGYLPGGTARPPGSGETGAQMGHGRADRPAANTGYMWRYGAHTGDWPRRRGGGVISTPDQTIGISEWDDRNGGQRWPMGVSGRRG